MAQDRALQINFVGNEYGWGNLPFVHVAAELGQRLKGAPETTAFQVMSNRGHPRVRFEGDTPVPGDELALYGAVREGAFTGQPLPSTLELMQRTQMPVLEICMPGTETRIFYPARYRHVEPLAGRVYEVFKADCYSLIREYLMSHGYVPEGVLPIGAAEEAMQHANLFGRDFFLESFQRVGFQAVTNPQPGDVFIIGSTSQALHAAVLLPDGRILHHSPGRFSTVEPYEGYWKQQTLVTFRYVKGA